MEPQLTPQTNVFDAQNRHIRDCLVALTRGVDQLMNAGLTVTALSIEGAYPRIQVLPSRRCQRLPPATVIIKPGPNGGRIAERSAIVQGCEVRWIDRDYR